MEILTSDTSFVSEFKKCPYRKHTDLFSYFSSILLSEVKAGALASILDHENKSYTPEMVVQWAGKSPSPGQLHMASIASLDYLLLTSFISPSNALLFVTSLFYAGKPNPAS